MFHGIFEIHAFQTLLTGSELIKINHHENPAPEDVNEIYSLASICRLAYRKRDLCRGIFRTPVKYLRGRFLRKLKTVNYFRKKIHLRRLTGFWIRLCRDWFLSMLFGIISYELKLWKIFLHFCSILEIYVEFVLLFVHWFCIIIHCTIVLYQEVVNLEFDRSGHHVPFWKIAIHQLNCNLSYFLKPGEFISDTITSL